MTTWCAASICWRTAECWAVWPLAVCHALLCCSHTQGRTFGASLSSCWIKCCQCILTDESIRCHWWTLDTSCVEGAWYAYVLCCACLCRDSKTNRVLCHHQPAESWPRVSAQFCNLQLFIEECGIKWIYDQNWAGGLNIRLKIQWRMAPYFFISVFLWLSNGVNNQT